MIGSCIGIDIGLRLERVLVQDRALHIEWTEVIPLNLRDIERDVIIGVAAGKGWWILRASLDLNLTVAILFVLDLLMGAFYFLNTINSHAPQSSIFVSMKLKLTRSISYCVAPLNRLLAVHGLPASHTSKERMSQAACTGWPLIRIPRDHLMDQIESLLIGCCW